MVGAIGGWTSRRLLDWRLIYRFVLCHNEMPAVPFEVSLSSITIEASVVHRKCGTVQEADDERDGALVSIALAAASIADSRAAG